MKRFVLILVAALLAAVLPGRAALIDREAALARAATATTDTFPDAETVLVWDATAAFYRPDGTGAQTNEWYEKILTEKGRRNARTASFWMNVAYGGVEIEAAERIRPNGTSVPVDVAANSRLMTEPGQMDANIYDPANKILTLAIPNLAVGDVLRLLVVRTTTKARVPDAFSAYALFEHTAPILEMTHTIETPAERPLRTIRLRDPIDGGVHHTTEKLESGGVRHRWRATDVPQAFPEPDMPALHTCGQRLLASTLPDWETLSKWYWRLSEPRMAATVPDMQTTVDALVDGAETREARIRRIFTFVSQKIRYMGITPEDAAPGYEPHDVSLTFENRYGVCRDKAALLVVMLRMAGVEAFPVLIHVGERRDPDVPQLYFNHAIVAATSEAADATGAARYILMDPTNENTARLLPEYLCEKSFLVARPEGEALLESPALPAEENLMVIETTGTLSNGCLQARTRLVPRGVNDTMYRSGFSRMRRDDRRRYVERMLQRAMPGAVLTGLTVAPADLQSTTEPLVLTCDYTLPEALLSGGVDAAILPQLSGVFGMVNFVIGATGLEKRRFPLQTEIPCGVGEHIRLRTDLPARSFVPTDSEHLTSGGVAYARETICTGGVLEVASRLVLEKSLYTPEEYPVLRTALQRVERARRVVPIWSGEPAASDGGDCAAPEALAAAESDDVRILLEETVLTPDNATNAWTETIRVRKAIRTYAGKIRAGDLRMAYNPAMESVEVLAATVTQPDGTVRTVTDQEQHVMDQPWVAAAPRYPAGRILVVNFPGLEVGSVIGHTVRRRVLGASSRSVTKRFGGFDAIDVQRLIVEPGTNGTFALQDVDGNTERLEVTRAADGRVVVEARDLEAVLREDNLPPARHLFPDACFVGGGMDVWAHAALIERTLDACAVSQPLAAEKGRALTAGLAGTAARVRAIRDYVAKNIRVAGPAYYELPLSALSPADVTLAAGYGHAADVAILLKAMLAGVGVAARWELIDSDRLPGDSDPPGVSPASQFDTILVAVDDAGATYFLNDGSQYADLRATHAEGRLMADCQTHTWREVVPDAGHEQRVSTVYDLEILADGTAWVDVETRYFGSAVEGFRRQYAEMTPEKRRRHVLEVVSGYSRNAVRVGDYETDTEGYPGLRRFRMRIPGWALKAGAFMNIRLPGAAATAVAPRVCERRLPFYRDAAQVMDDRWNVRLPGGAGAIVLKPEEVNFRLADGSTELETVCVTPAAADRPMLEVRRRTKLGRTLTSPADYTAYMRAALTVQGRAGDTVIIRDSEAAAPDDDGG